MVQLILSWHSANQYVLLPFILVASGGSAGPARWCLTFSGNTYSVDTSHCQYSFHQCVPTDISFTDFWCFMDGKKLMSLIQYTVLTVTVESVKWGRSLQYNIRSLNFKFTRETLWLSRLIRSSQFSCAPMEYDKHLVIPSCYKYPNSEYKYWCMRNKFCKKIK